MTIQLNKTTNILESDNVTFVFRYKKSFAYKISATLMLIYSIYLIQVYLFGGIILTIGSFLFISHVSGVELDLKQKKYRNVKIVGNQSFGGWQDLPEIKYISVFRTVIASSVMGRSGAIVTSREKTILINLVHGKNQRLRVYKTENLEDAFEKAKYFSEKLNVRIFDATLKRGKWLE